MTNSSFNEIRLTNRDRLRQVLVSRHSTLRAALVGTTVLMSIALSAPAGAQAQPPQQRPNIVMIMADDVGIWNISAYHRGMMGGSTPNIDRIAKEGALFTDYYAQQSCTAGRAAFILGQTPFRTGLLTVGLPAAKEGIQDKDPTIAELLKPYGYATAQIGKNHLGDRNEYLPTVHGFDEFYGILYHLNAMASAPISARATSWTARRLRWTIRLLTPAGARSAGKRSPMAVRCRRIRIWIPMPRPIWKMSMTNWFAGPSISWTGPSRTISRSSFGTTRPVPMCGPISRLNGRTKAASDYTPMQ
jgi:hypothetical protein